MPYAASLTAIGVLSLSLMAAMVAHLSSPQLMLDHATGSAPVIQMQRLQETHGKTGAFKTSHHLHHHPKARHHHEHRSPGKPGAAVALVGGGVQTLTLASPRDLELTLESHLTRGLVRVQLDASADLELLGAVREWNFDVDGNQTLRLPITVRANAEGQHYVHLFIEHEDVDGNTTARALAAPFHVGQRLGNLHEKSLSAAAASEFRTLPAREVIY